MYPDSGVSIDLFTKQLPKSSYISYPYNIPLDAAAVTSSLQTQAATLIPKMKTDGITSVVLFGVANAAVPMTAAATSQGFSPEWVLPGSLGIDVSVTARGIDQAQWAHAFGIGQLFPPIVGAALNQNTALFNWYWGPNNGTYQSGGTGFFNLLFTGMSLAGPKLTPQTLQQGLFSIPANGGAATGNTQNYMTGYGPAAGLPYNEFAGLGYDYYMYWWDPTNVGVSNIASISGTGRYAYLNNGLRFVFGHVGEGRSEVLRQDGLHLRRDHVDDSDRRASDAPCPRHPAHVPVRRMPELGRGYHQVAAFPGTVGSVRRPHRPPSCQGRAHWPPGCHHTRRGRSPLPGTTC